MTYRVRGGADGVCTAIISICILTASATTFTGCSGGSSGSGRSSSSAVTAGSTIGSQPESGDRQRGEVGSRLGQPLAVRVADGQGSVRAGVNVDFAVTMGDATVTPASSLTDADGVASTILTLGRTAGPVAVTATPENSKATTLTAMSEPGAASRIELNSGNGGIGTVGSTLSDPFILTIYDAMDNPIPDQNVQFTVTAGNGLLSGQSVLSVVTNAKGQAITAFTIGTTAGANEVTANVPGQPAAAPITYGATGTVGPAAAVEIASGDAQTGVAGSPLGAPFVARISDQYGNRVENAQVDFSVTMGNGALSVASATTDVNGHAPVILTTDTVVGTNVVTAITPTLPALPITFTASGTVGAASQIASTAGANQTAVAGSGLQPFVVTVADANGNVVPGFMVQFAITAGGGLLSAATVPTDAQGIAQSILTLGTAAGANTVTAGGTGLTPITFSATGIAGPAVTLASSAGNNQSGVVGTALGAPFVVLITDVNNNPASNVAVQFSITRGGGQLSAANVTTNAQGLAQTTLTLGATVGMNQVMATSTGLTGSPLTFVASSMAGPASAVAPTSGDAQTGVPGTPLAQPLVVTVRDANTNLVQGYMVQFAVTAGGGSVSATSVATDAQGRAATTLTLGSAAGANTVRVTAPGLTGAPFTFSATAQPIATAIALGSGNNQTATVGTPLTSPFVVRVTDAAGNGVPAIDVTFAVTAGGGAISATDVTTDAQGNARTFLTLGAVAGANTVTATSAGLTGSPIVFAAQAMALAPSAASVASGNAQTLVAGTPSAPLVVRVVDQNGDGIAGFQVTYQVASGGGTLSQATVATDAQGNAQSVLTSGATAGPNSVVATAPGLAGSPLTFTLTGTAGPATALAIASGDNQSAVVGTALAQPFVVRVTDANGNAAANVPVSFAVTAGGGSLSATNVTTNARGEASSSLTLGATAVMNTVSITSAGLSGSPSTFNASAMAAPAAQVRLTSGTNQTGVVGAPLAQPFVVTVTDAGGNGVQGFIVTFAVGAGGGALSASSVMTDAQGAARTTLTLGGSAGQNTVVATATGLAGGPLTFVANGVAGTASQMAIASGDNQSGLIGASLAQPLVMRVADPNNNPVQNVTVTFAVLTGGGSVLATSVSTDAQGLAATSLTLGATVGANTVRATSVGLSGSPTTFTAMGTTAPASSIALASGDAQRAVAGSALQPFVVTVRDAGNNPVQGFAVGFAVATGGGQLSATSVTTDAQGNAATILTLGATAGTNTVTVTAPGLTGSPRTITATGIAGAATTLVLESGNNQNGVVGTALAQPLSLRVTDANGNPISAHTVTFAVSAGGGTLSATSVMTDNAGRAQAGLTLGAAVGQNTVTANAPGLGGSPATFSAQATAAAASGIAATLGNNQTGVAGAALPNAFVVTVTDANNNPVAGYQVTFAVTQGNGTLDATSVMTNAAGVAPTILTLGTQAGVNLVTASGNGLTGSPIQFSATGIAGPATRIAVVSGDAQSGLAGAALAQPFVISAQDANGNGVQNTAVTFAVTAGGGTLSATSVTTDAQGRAQSTLTLGAAVAANTVTASATGLTPATFTASATAAPASRIALTSGTGQTGVAGSALAQPFAVTVTDANGNGVQGFMLSFTVSAGGGTISASNVTTDAQGRAQTVLTLGATAGTNEVTANAAGLTGSPITFSANGTAGTPATLARTSGNNQSGTAGGALAQPFVVTVTDAGGNAVAGHAVAFAVATGNGTLSTASTTTNSTGRAETTLTLGPSAGTNTVSASSNGLTTVTFTATAQAQPPAAVAVATGANQSARIGMALTDPIVFRVTNASGNPVQGVSLAFAIGSGGGSLSVASGTTDAQGNASTQLTVGTNLGANSVTATAQGIPAATANAMATALTYVDDLQAVLATRCTSCHTTGFFFSPLLTFDQVLNGQTAAAQPFVVPFNASTSVLVQKTTAPGTMSAYLSASEAQLISDWVRTGAVNGGVAMPPATVEVTSGDNQSTAVGTALQNPLVVTVKDVNGAPLANVDVVFAVATGGGALSASTVSTNVFGAAEAALTVGATAGSNTVTATVAALTPVTFTAQGVVAYSGEPLASSAHPLDVAALVALRANFVEPSALSSDGEFLRRVTSDLVGRLPTEAELTAFENNASAAKRAQVIDQLLSTAEFAKHWTTDIVGNWVETRPSVNYDDGNGNTVTALFDNTLEQAIANDVSLADVVKNLSTGGNDPLAYGRAFAETHDGNNGTSAADRLVHAFAGMSVTCSRCHDHPLTTPNDDPRLNQDDVYSLYAFFATSTNGARKRNKLGQRFGTPLEPGFVLDGNANAVPGLPQLSDPLNVRRTAFGDVFTQSDAFARGTAHRIWSEIASELLNTNEFLAANLAAVRSPALLAALTQLFKDQNSSLKGFLRQAMNSRLYQLSSAGNDLSADPFQGRYVLRRHHSEVIGEGIFQVAGLNYNGNDTNFRINFGYPDVNDRSLMSARNNDLGLSQALMQANSPSSISSRVTNSGSQVRALATAVDGAQMTFDAAVTTIVRSALSRNPTAAELTALRSATNGATNREALEDIAVGVANSAEFMFR
jgi:adhesin/invasin